MRHVDSLSRIYDENEFTLKDNEPFTLSLIVIVIQNTIKDRPDYEIQNRHVI